MPLDPSADGSRPSILVIDDELKIRGMVRDAIAQDAERLLVAARPHDSISDTHWLRADVDHHFVRQAITAGVDYRDRVDLTSADVTSDSVRLTAARSSCVRM